MVDFALQYIEIGDILPFVTMTLREVKAIDTST